MKPQSSPHTQVTQLCHEQLWLFAGEEEKTTFFGSSDVENF
jgi:hypothetical protein